MNVYFFGGGKADGNAELKDLLGGKGANLHEMARLGIPVPPGFTISTEVCKWYYAHNETYPEGLKEEIIANLHKIEKIMRKKFGAKDNPLLLSVRSGARASMPGMMDSILNIGLNDENVLALIKESQQGVPLRRDGSSTSDTRLIDEIFAYDCYRRLIQMYGDVVLGVSMSGFDKIYEDTPICRDRSRPAPTQELIIKYKAYIKEKKGIDFPMDPMEQLWGAISAVFKSWNNKRAIEYRRINNIPADWGTACNVQAMVFGNMQGMAGTGVAFTRNRSTGENVFYGEWLPNVQGEDVVAGIRTPYPINKAQNPKLADMSLETKMPKMYSELLDIRELLEKHYKEMQDIEFTIEKGKLWMLQTRRGQRTPTASVKIAVDMVEEGMIDEETAVMRVAPSDIDALLHPILDPKVEIESIATGLPASPGAASGKVVFTPEDAVKLKEQGEASILVRFETSPEDIAGMASCEGILTQRGGITSHAAVVAGGMGKPCIVGCEMLSINYDKEEMKINVGTNFPPHPESLREKAVTIRACVIKKGDILTIDGASGRVMLGNIPKISPSLKGEFGKILEYADKIRRLGVRANADDPKSAKLAREFKAEGIGLCRTEHMFFGKDRIRAMREMILADNEQQRRKALEKLLPMQKEDFKGIFREMDGFPVIIRTLDPPLHEFLPHNDEQIKELAEDIGVSVEKIKEKITSLSEANPMLGHRGCRLGISYPEITEMQARAVFEATAEVMKEGIKVIPGVMIPVVGEAREFKNQRNIVDRVAREVMQYDKIQFNYKVGTMIEIPRAALTADKIAQNADFFSYGTNDLTQTTFGFSRDDVGKILKDYIAKGILKWDPFQRLDEEGVGALVKMGVERGRSSNKNLEIGICGEHGGEPNSVEFCHKVGLDYVSCSPYRVPVARLAAARAVISAKGGSASGGKEKNNGGTAQEVH